MSGFIGILSLDHRFPRISGDAGNPHSYRLPARVRVIAGADSPQIVRDGRPDDKLSARFLRAAQELEAEGASVITSTCGFLISMQDEIAAALRIPVMLSALSMVPVLKAAQVCGILTASARSLGPQALQAAGIEAERVRIQGLEDRPLFASTFLAAKDSQPTGFDRAAMEAEVIAASQSLINAHPDIAHIVLECGNLPPYAGAIRRQTGLPVTSIIDAVNAMTASAYSSRWE